MTAGGSVEVPGFVDHHTHLLKAASGLPSPWQGGTVRAFHERVWRDGSTPMDVDDQASGFSPSELAVRLRAGLATAAQAGLVEITEMGLRDWAYLDALTSDSASKSLPARVRIYLASGLADSASDAELAARRDSVTDWIRLDGIKFYADGWLGPRTCAMCRDFDDTAGSGLLFTDAAKLARRVERFAARGWRIATHAIGDLGVQTVLDAYELAWGRDRDAIAQARPRIEHASLLSADAIARMAELGVWAGIQPSFALTDAHHLEPALGADRVETAYPWAALAASGVQLLAGTDFPIEVIEPLVGIARLVTGRSARPGFGTEQSTPERSRLPVDAVLAMYTDATAGQATLSADPRRPSANLDEIDVISTQPSPF